MNKSIVLLLPSFIGMMLLIMAIMMKIDATHVAKNCHDLSCMGDDYIPPMMNIWGAIWVYLTWIIQLILCRKKAKFKYWLMIYLVIITIVLYAILPIS